MKIHSLHLRNYRHQRDVKHTLNATGITIIQGPNESGKSCFVEALDHLLEDLDSSRGQAIKDLQPSGRDVGPEVEADIECGDYRFTYHKRWLRSPETVLQILTPRPESITGRPAHEKVQEILRATLDVALYKAVRITQSDGGFDLPELPEESSLTRALDAAAGGTPIGPREAALINRAEAEFRTYWQENRRPKTLVTDADERFRLAQGELTELAGKIVEADQDTVRHELVTRQLVDLVQRRPALEKTAQEWDAKKKGVESAQEQLTVLDAQAQALRSDHHVAAQAQTVRSEFVEEVERSRKTAEEAKRIVEANQDGADTARATAQAARVTAEGAEAEASLARIQSRLRKNDSDALHYQFDLTLLRERRAKATTAQGKRQDAEAILATNKVTEDVLAKVRKADQEVAVAAARLQDASPTVTITAKKKTDLMIAGKPFSATPKAHTVPVPSHATIRIDDVTVEVRAGTSLEDLQETHAEAKEALEELLEHHDAKDLEAAIRIHDDRRDAEAVKKKADQDVKDALRSEKPLAFKSLDEMDAKIGEVDARIAAILQARPKDPPLPKTKDEAKRLSDETQDKADVDERAAAEKRALAEAATDASAKLSEKQAERRIKADHLADAHRVSKDRLDAARKTTADEGLAQAAASAALRLKDAELKASDAKKEIQKTDPDVVLDRARSATDAVKRLDQDAQELRTQQNTLVGKLQVHMGQGLHERHQKAAAELEAAQAAATSLHRRADTAKLLYETLQRHRSAASQRYVGPLRDRITKLGKFVYGDGFGVDIDDKLVVTHRSLNGDNLPYRSLSKGAREQLSLLTRLACAMVVTTDGKGGVPIIIDDALGYTDPKRLEAMGAVLDRAGRDCQVLILTCTPDRYQTVSTAVAQRLG